ncbi:MAG: hypothetical protein RIR70_1527 [Pseudomonadota bacterium]|jgi:CrcB protein
MNWTAFAGVGAGAALGAWARWGLSAWLNPLLPLMPLGTLAANLVGGYLIGVALALFAHLPALSPEWRLFLVTGFLGGLTTFSSFSAEVVGLVSRAQYGFAFACALAHVVGSLTLTAAGMLTVDVLRG